MLEPPSVNQNHPKMELKCKQRDIIKIIHNEFETFQWELLRQQDLVFATVEAKNVVINSKQATTASQS